MHVGLNLVYLVPGETGGMEIYAREFAPALAQAAPGIGITAFVNREAAASGLDLGSGIRTVPVPVHARNRIGWVAGEQLYLPRLGKQRRVDLLHSLASTAPVWGGFARVTTVHDLIYRRFPEAHFGVRTLGMRVLVPLAVRRSDRVIAVSHSTASDLQLLLRVPSEKIDVIHQGHGDPPQRAAAPEPGQQVRERWQINERQVVLTLSAKRPVKNLIRLLEALVLIPADRRPVLLMPGYPTEFEPQLHQRARQLNIEADVRIPGWLPDEQLEGLWRVADCFVFPSLYEGFGAPVLEAMQRGVPVACSNRGSLPEVAGNAARFFDPERPSEIAVAIEALLADEHERGQLVQRGFAQAKRFTWAQTAKLTLATYERALQC